MWDFRGDGRGGVGPKIPLGLVEVLTELLYGSIARDNQNPKTG